MGRVKLAIKKIETPVGKQVTYSKRKAGLEKKAKELATLCDIDLLLILFSPAGKLSWINGSNSPPEEVLMRFANLSVQERAKRKVEALEQLKRTFKKLDHDVNVEEFTKPVFTAQNIEELHLYLQNIQIESLNLQQKLRRYESFQTIEEADKLEDFLQSRIHDVQVHKQLLESSQCIFPYAAAVAAQQVYSEVVGNPEDLNNTAQDAWEAAHRSRETIGFQQNFFDQRATDPSDCLRQNAFNPDKGVEGANHLFSGFKEIGYKDCSTVNGNKVRFNMEANCSKVMDYRDGNPSSLDDSSFVRNDISAHCHWSPASNGMQSQSEMIASQNPRPHYLQHCYVSGDVKVANIQQEESSRGHMMGEIAENVDWQR